MLEINMKKYTIIVIILILVTINLVAEPVAERLKIGLVLSGGGSRGIAHIGVLRVLEDLGIEPDYITGTSMGAIIGGLYAIGYRSEELEEIMENQNWPSLLMDEMLLSDVSYEEKEFIERYIGELPIVDYRIKLPTGIVAGQRVAKFLSDLTISAQQINNFDELHTPFRCIATDLETGDAVVLKEGTIAEAMRISMSIPSAFNPVEKDGKILIDGGIARNLPVQDAIDMGADIVIAVDVSSKLYEKKQLNSLVKVMEQSVNFRGIERSREQQKLCDILILPDVSDTSIRDFSDTSGLVKKGNAAAKEHLEILQAIATEQKKYEREDKGIPILKVEKLRLNEIDVVGLETVSKNLIIGKMSLDEHSTITFAELSEAIERLWGSQYFERVTYRLLPSENGVDLEVMIVEKTNRVFNFSFNYNTETKAEVLLNITARNLLLEGSRFSVDAKLSETPGFATSHFLNLGWKPGFGIVIKTQAERYEIDLKTGNEINYYYYDQYLADFIFQTIFVNSAAFGVGTKYEINRINAKDDTDVKTVKDDLLNSYAFFKLNSLDRKYYPKKGAEITAQYEYIYSIGSNNESDSYEPFSRIHYSSDKYLPISEQITLNLGLEVGTVTGVFGEIPITYNYSFGGNRKIAQNNVPFDGFAANTVHNTNFWMLRAAVQLNIWKEIYLTPVVNVLNHDDDLKGVFDVTDLIIGVGGNLGIRTPFGKLEYSISKNSIDGEFYHYFNVGHRF